MLIGLPVSRCDNIAFVELFIYFDLEVIVDKNYGAFNLPSIIPATFTSAGYEVDAHACYFEILEEHGVNVAKFIRSAIQEKIERDWKQIKEQNEKEYCPF